MQCRVLENQCLTQQDAEKSVFYLKLVSDSPMIYQEGDWVLVKARNPENLVKHIIRTLALSGDETLDLRRVGQVSVFEALSEHLEITQLTPAVLNKCQRAFELSLWQDRQAMMDYAEGKDVLDLLQADAILSKKGLDFLSCLVTLGPRYYSIASSPTTSQNQVALLYKQVRYEKGGRLREGVVTRYLSGLSAGEKLEVSFAENRAFRLPDNAETDIVMIGAGTGLAPYLGFIENRVSSQGRGKNWLFFGETYSESNFYFREPLQSYESGNKLKLTTAFSRETPDKCYVQDQMNAEFNQLKTWYSEGAHFYVCGDKNGMAKAVESILKQIVVAVDAPQDIESAYRALKRAGRIQLDVY